LPQVAKQNQMKKEIPAPVIAVLADNLPNIETQAALDNLFLHADAPGDPPEGSKPVKTQTWLRRINNPQKNAFLILIDIFRSALSTLEMSGKKV
jgi:hypothetical protein